MPRIASPLTDAKLRSLKPKDRPYEVSDGGHPGLKVEVLPSGAKVWRFRYVLNGRREKLTLGEMGLAAARERYNAARALVTDGISPTVEKRRDKARNADQEATVAGFFQHRYIPDHLSKLRSHERVEKLIRREVLPSIGRLRLEQVGVEDIQRILDRIKAKGNEASAVLTRAWMSSLFELAVDRHRIATNPVKLIKRKRVGKPPVRDRVMTPRELGLYVKALGSGSTDGPLGRAISPKQRLALELILLTACRRAELVKARWAHVDLEARVWVIPPENQKAAIEQRVYLSDRALEIMDALQVMAGASLWVLPAERDHRNHLHAEMLNTAKGRLVLASPELSALSPFTIHDGRRAFSTWGHECLEHPDVVEACLGHTIKGVRGIYARPQFEDARRQLMQAWADHLHAVAQENVVPLRSNAAA